MENERSNPVDSPSRRTKKLEKRVDQVCTELGRKKHESLPAGAASTIPKLAIARQNAFTLHVTAKLRNDQGTVQLRRLCRQPLGANCCWGFHFHEEYLMRGRLRSDS